MICAGIPHPSLLDLSNKGKSQKVKEKKKKKLGQ